MSIPDSASELRLDLDTAHLPDGSRLLVAVSGGPDSVALLHAVQRLAPARRWTVSAGHVHHGLRGEEADLDAAFVRDLCRRLDIGCAFERVDVAGYAAERRCSLETAGRALRYDSLERMRRAAATDVILTAHTADDQAETLLMRLLRGTGLSGLGGIRARQGLIVRPLLAVRHDTVLSYLQSIGEGYRLDSSNLDLRHARNRIRRRLLPAVLREAPRAIEALARTAALLGDDGSYLGSEIEEALARLREGDAIQARLWRALHPALRRGTMRAAAGTPLEAAQVEEACGVVFAAEKLVRRPIAHGLVLFADRAVFRFEPAGDVPAATIPSVIAPVPGDIDSPAGHLHAVRIEPGRLPDLLAVCDRWHALCRASALPPEVEIRGRRPGEHLRPLGAPGRRRVQDILVDAHVPAALRAGYPVVAAGSRVLWLPGLYLAHDIAATTADKDLILLSFRPSSAVYRGRIPVISALTFSQ